MFFKSKYRNAAVKPDIKSPEGFAYVYNEYWEAVYAVCFNQVRDTAIVQGMVQDIFVSIWERRNDLQIEKSIQNYLLRAARLKVFEHFRNQAIREKHLQCMARDYCVVANCTEDAVNFSALLKELNMLVDRLPCQCRQVFRMRHEQGLTNRQIALALKISERAVEYHINKAMKVLKNELQEGTLVV